MAWKMGGIALNLCRFALKLGEIALKLGETPW
jgi:hypothetical protein